jgi:hypothetical protein
MTPSPHAARLLGLDRRHGWRLLRLPDGQVQLDLGAAGLVLAPAEFAAWAALLEQAAALPLTADWLRAPWHPANACATAPRTNW